MYIGRITDIMPFIPTYSYNIIIRYEDNFKFLREFQFSLMCADVEDVNNFINNFNISNKVEERYVVYEKRKFWKKLLSGILTLAIIVLVTIYFLKKMS